MKHGRPDIETIRAKFDKTWFPFDFEGGPWQKTVPTMSNDFTDTCQPWMQMDMTAVWNEENACDLQFKLYQLCKHKIYIWTDTDFTRPKVVKVGKSVLKKLILNDDNLVITSSPKIVIMECLAGELMTMLQGRVDLGFNFNSKSHYFMMGAVVAENYMVFNSLKEFKLP